MPDQTHVARPIFDLLREVRSHPDFAFGVVFTRGDFPGGVIPDDFAGKYIEDALAERGSEYIYEEVGEDADDEDADDEN